MIRLKIWQKYFNSDCPFIKIERLKKRGDKIAVGIDEYNIIENVKNKETDF